MAISFRTVLRIIYEVVGWRCPRKPRVPHCEEWPGAAHSRRDQMCVCGFRAHPPTRRGGEHWSYHGSGRFGDTMPWRTRVARGARDWDASAIPPGEVLDKHNGFYCVAVCFPAVVIIFFRDSPLRGGMFGFRPGWTLAHLAHIECVCHHRGHHTARSDTPMQVVSRQFRPNERLFAFLDDVYLTSKPFWKNNSESMLASTSIWGRRRCGTKQA